MKFISFFDISNLISLIKKILFIIIVASIGYAVFSFLPNKEYSLDFAQKDTAGYLGLGAAGKPQEQKQRDYSLFLNEIEQREIFGSVLQEEKPSPAGKSDSKEIAKIIENLRLSGILAKAPLRAIIEDRKTGRTFYVKEGESVANEITVDKIGENSVVLDYHGEKFELYF